MNVLQLEKESVTLVFLSSQHSSKTFRTCHRFLLFFTLPIPPVFFYNSSPHLFFFSPAQKKVSTLEVYRRPGRIVLPEHFLWSRLPTWGTPGRRCRGWGRSYIKGRNTWNSVRFPPYPHLHSPLLVWPASMMLSPLHFCCASPLIRLFFAFFPALLLGGGGFFFQPMTSAVLSSLDRNWAHFSPTGIALSLSLFTPTHLFRMSQFTLFWGSSF